MTGFPVRVTLMDTWDELSLEVPPETTFTELKRRVLELSHSPRDPARFVVKYRGAQVLEEGATLSSLGVPRNAALIMLPRRREPVR